MLPDARRGRTTRSAPQLICALAGVAFAGVSTIATAQTPVNDSIAWTQRLDQHEEIRDDYWKPHMQAMDDQLAELEAIHATLSERRLTGQAIDDATLGSYMVPGFEAVYDGLRDTGRAALSGDALTEATANQVFDACAVWTTDAEQRQACEYRAAKSVVDRTLWTDGLADVQGQFAQLEALKDEIYAADTDDAMSILVLNARIQAETAKLVAEQTRAGMMRNVQEDTESVMRQRQREREARAWTSGNGIVPTDPP